MDMMGTIQYILGLGATALILVLITILLGVILPGNKTLPLGDLATIPFFVSVIVASRKGNIITSVITGTIVMAASLYMATDFAPVFQKLNKPIKQTGE